MCTCPARLSLQNPDRWGCSCFSAFAKEGKFPDFSRTPAVSDKASRQQVFLLVGRQHPPLGWADRRALINNHFYQSFQDLALEVVFLIPGVCLSFNLEKASFQKSLSLPKIKQAMRDLSHISLFGSFLWAVSY